MSAPPPPDVIELVPVLKADAPEVDGRLARARAWLGRPRHLGALLVVLVLGGVAGLLWQGSQPAPWVLVGQVEAQEVNVLAPAAGQLTRLHVASGQRIDAGAALFELDAGNGSASPVGWLGSQVAPVQAQPQGQVAATGLASGLTVGLTTASMTLTSSPRQIARRDVAGAPATGWQHALLTRPGVDRSALRRVAGEALSTAQATQLAQARAEVERTRQEAARFERTAELAHAAWQRAQDLYTDSMIDRGARDAAQAQWQSADAQVRAARGRAEQARRQLADLLAGLPPQAAVAPPRAPARSGEAGPSSNQALPAAQAPTPPTATPRQAAPGNATATNPPATNPPTTSPAAPPAPPPAEAAPRAPAAPVYAGRLLLRSPVAGEVERISAQVGQKVVAGQWLMSVVNLSDLWVVAVVREDRLPAYAYGSEHEGSVVGLGAQARFKVESVTQLPDFATWRSAGGAELRSFEVRLRSLSALPGLRPGMSVHFQPAPPAVPGGTL
ncbi:MAG: hypothetical protein RL722_42 [Pseudomonadota bacterium]|jgi:multidrug resistance efflux pump